MTELKILRGRRLKLSRFSTIYSTWGVTDFLWSFVSFYGILKEAIAIALVCEVTVHETNCQIYSLK